MSNSFKNDINKNNGKATGASYSDAGRIAYSAAGSTYAGHGHGHAAKILAVMMAVFISLFMLTACGADKNDSSGKKEDETEYRVAKHVNFPISPIKSMNPCNSKDEDTYFIARLVYDGLFKMDNTMTPQKDLVEDYKIGDNSVTVTLIDTEFHDGKKLKAKDVQFTIEAFKYAGKKCPYYSLVKNISYTDVQSSKKIKIYFSSSTNMGLDMLTFPILPAHRYDSAWSLAYSTGKFKMVGTGQYKYKSYNADKSLELIANKNYHGTVAENNVSFIVVSGKATAFQLVEASSLSAVVTRSIEREANVQQKKQRIIDFPGNEMEFIGFNFNNNQTYSKDIRKAVATCIDNETLIQEVYINSGMLTDSMYYYGYLGTEKGKDPYAYDTDKATTYLDRAGYTDRNDDGWVENSYGSSITLTILVNSDKERCVETAEFIQENLEAVGIHSYITRVPTKTYQGSLKNGSFDIYVGELKFDETMDLRELLVGEQQVFKSSAGSQTHNDHGGLTHSESDTESTTTNQSDKTMLSKKMNNLNYVRYYNEKTNELLDQLKSGKSIESLQKTYLKLKKQLNSDLPYYCLLQRTYGAVTSPTLEGDMDPVFDNYYNGIGSMQVKYEVAPKDDEEEGE